jgi:periplasmic divalent cation tolerance protein
MNMRILLATCSPDKADEVLLALLHEKLVACGNLIPGVVSHYWWQGEICRDEEVVMLMETRADLAAAAAQRLAELHPYDVPKILTLDPASCNDDYLAWVRSVTAEPR